MLNAECNATMYLKIYFNNKPLFLCDGIDDTIQPYLHHDDSVFIDELDTHTLKSMIHEMQLPKIHAGVFFHFDLEKLKQAFWKKFTLVKAGGGIVENEKSEILLMFRRGKWDLPKGKLDKGEKIDACALREVKEETGLQKVTLLKALLTTYHTYHEGTKFILKETYWFSMKADGKQGLTPQAEEDISEVKWVKKTDLKKYASDTYASVAEVLGAYLAGIK
jgi:ADP-ribose pyrophosphatase YjhB (NUDIX family)